MSFVHMNFVKLSLCKENSKSHGHCAGALQELSPAPSPWGNFSLGEVHVLFVTGSVP